MENTFEYLRDYLHTRYKIDPRLVRRDVCLMDLEIHGDDIDDFLYHLINNFSIEVKQLDLSRFDKGSEPFDLLYTLSKLLPKSAYPQKQPLRIENIEKFIETGILK